MLTKFLEFQIDDFLMSEKSILNEEITRSIYHDFENAKINPVYLYLLHQSLNQIGIHINRVFDKSSILEKIIKNPKLRINTLHLYGEFLMERKGFDIFIKQINEKIKWGNNLGLNSWRVINESADELNDKELAFLLKSYKKNDINDIYIFYESKNRFIKKLMQKSPLKWNFNRKRSLLKKLLKYPRFANWANLQLFLIENI